MYLQHEFLYDQSLDFPDYTKPPNKVICLYFVPRSGSNLLADLMRQTGRLGFPLEYFDPGNLSILGKRMPGLAHHDFSMLFAKRTSRNGVFSFKWNSNSERLDYGNKVRTMLSPRFHIYIDRLNREAQARSYCIAMKTRIWVRRKGSAAHNVFFEPSKDDVKTACQELSRVRKDTLKLLQETAVSYLTVNAETLFSDPVETLIHVLQYCEIDHQGVRMPSEALWTAPSSEARGAPPK